MRIEGWEVTIGYKRFFLTNQKHVMQLANILAEATRVPARTSPEQPLVPTVKPYPYEIFTMRQAVLETQAPATEAASADQKKAQQTE